MEEITLLSVKQWKAKIPKTEETEEFLEITSSLTAVHATTLFSELIQSLENLVAKCESYAIALQTEPTKGQFSTTLNFKKLNDLHMQALVLLKSILEVESNEDLVVRLSKIKELSSDSKIYRVFPHQFEKSVDESKLRNVLYKNDRGVQYFNKDELERRRVIICNGRFHHIVRNGSREDKTIVFKPFSTKKLWRLGDHGPAEEKGKAIIAVDKDGNMFAARTCPNRYNAIRHASLTGDEPVFFAGVIMTDDSGKLLEINNSSGRYQCHREDFNNFFDLVIERGAATPSLKTYSDRGGDLFGRRIFSEFKPESKPFGELETWKSESNPGVFFTRYSVLKEIDALYETYLKMSGVHKPKQKLALIDQILEKIEIQSKTHPRSCRKMAIENLKKTLTKEKESLTMESKSEGKKKKISINHDFTISFG